MEQKLMFITLNMLSLRHLLGMFFAFRTWVFIVFYNHNFDYLLFRHNQVHFNYLKT